VKIDAHFEPNPANRKTYEPMYGEFRKIYRSQKKMFKRLGHVG
jgi:sugar (pentulose or hexulose) kinase